MSAISFIFSLIFSVIWVTSVYFDVKFQPRLGHDWYIYKLIMLTNLNFILDTIYSVLVLLSYTGCQRVRNLVDYLFFTSVFPIALITCGLFWGLYAIEPALVMPDWVAKLIPGWLNHVTHTLPVVFVYADAYFHQRSPPTNRSALKVSATLVAVYFVIIFYVRFFDGYWLYPLLELFSNTHFILAYFAGVLGFFGLTQAAKLTNWLFWRANKKLKQK
ncbi:unnamed protein product [Caenorhabditis angaria]|uniref:Uncharacterized protein n=1 Tax=Caenorhabditis angaria TaxID=860376 RepID=A0A9P1NC80_9PELO|nr:unnamed protein product [Caenorhabditis angaria]